MTLIVHYCVLCIASDSEVAIYINIALCAHELHSTLLIATLDKGVLWLLAVINIHPLKASAIGVYTKL